MTTKYKKCMDCPFFENKCYVNPESVVSVCNKYNCVTSPESTCLTHKKHNHSNYEPELNASSADSCYGHYPDNECDQATCKDLCEDIEECKRITNEASSAGRTQTRATSPPFDVNAGPRQPKTQEDPHFVMPSKSGSNLPVSPSKE